MSDLKIRKVCTACSRAGYKIVPLTNLKKYLYSGKSDIKGNINNGSEKFCKNTATIGELITTEYAPAVYVYISCTYYSDRLEYKSHLLDQRVGI
jgi:hypothetical protein